MVQDSAANFYGYTFEADFLLFASEFEEVPAVYVIYTPEVVLYVGQSENLKDALETHEDTMSWVKSAGKDDIYVAFYPNDDLVSRVEMQSFLTDKMNPICVYPQLSN